MYLPITTLSACILGFLLGILSLRIINVRGKEKVSLGSGESQTLERRIRAQGNLVEYALMGLILIGLAELQIVAIYSKRRSILKHDKRSRWQIT